MAERMKMKDIRSEVYNALSEIIFKTNASKQDMDRAIDWFQIHFYEDNIEEDK